MALLEILQFPNPILRKKCTKITEINKDLIRLADDMCETLDYHKGVGLAGNQVGYMKRIVVIKIPDEEQFRVLINPEITETFGNREVEEGCLSVFGYKGIVNITSVPVVPTLARSIVSTSILDVLPWLISSNLF